jgi:hypothetical protein
LQNIPPEEFFSIVPVASAFMKPAFNSEAGLVVPCDPRRMIGVAESPRRGDLVRMCKCAPLLGRPDLVILRWAVAHLLLI